MVQQENLFSAVHAGGIRIINCSSFLDECSSLGTDLQKREGVPEMGTKPRKVLRGYQTSNRGSKRL